MMFLLLIVNDQKIEEILGLKFKRNLDSNSSFINQEKTKKESLRTINMTMPKGWKDWVDIARKKLKTKQEKKLKQSKKRS